MQKHFVIGFALLAAFSISFGQSQRRKRFTVGVDHMPQVSLERVSADSKVPVYFCDGIVIHPNWILASAHCFDSDNSTNFIIRYGTIYADEDGMTVTPEHLLLLPSYNQNESVSTQSIALICIKTLELNNGTSMSSQIQVAINEISKDMLIFGNSDDSAVTNSEQLVDMESIGEECDPSYLSRVFTYAGQYAPWIIVIILLVLLNTRTQKIQIYQNRFHFPQSIASPRSEFEMTRCA